MATGISNQVPFVRGILLSVLLALCLIVSVVLAVNQFPEYLAMFSDL